MKFKEGDLVIISDSANEYEKRHIGRTGEVASIYYRLNNRYIYGIRIHSLYNTSSKNGLFWFKPESLELYTQEDESSPLIIESEEIPMFENYVVARVQFLNDPIPTYAYALYEDIPAGTVVVVKTGSHGFALARIESIDTNPEAKGEVRKNRQVVCPVDFSAYEARNEALRKVSELQKQMEAKLREVQTMAIYEMFAEKDDSLKAMLDEFKTLQATIKGESSEQTEVMP